MLLSSGAAARDDGSSARHRTPHQGSDTDRAVSWTKKLLRREGPCRWQARDSPSPRRLASVGRSFPPDRSGLRRTRRRRNCRPRDPRCSGRYRCASFGGEVGVLVGVIVRKLLDHSDRASSCSQTICTHFPAGARSQIDDRGRNANVSELFPPVSLSLPAPPSMP